MNNTKINMFLKSPAFAVFGASSNRAKYGNKVLRCFMQNGKKVYPVNPHEELIEGLTVLRGVDELPAEVESISIITPPVVTERIVTAAIKRGIKNIWMQPGAESEAAIKQCESNQINLIAGGSCILVVMGYLER